MIDQTQNSTLDDKEKILQSVKQNTDKIRQELGELLQNTWNSKITEIKQTMKSVEAERKKAVGSTDTTKHAQLEKDYKAKMDDLSR